MSDIKLVQFECPKKLLEEFDVALKEANFSKRAEALRHLMRDFVDQQKRSRSRFKEA